VLPDTGHRAAPRGEGVTVVVSPADRADA
jgi:hypothetical protein